MGKINWKAAIVILCALAASIIVLRLVQGLIP